jgi:hypothetical protein
LAFVIYIVETYPDAPLGARPGEDSYVLGAAIQWVIDECVN